MPAPKLLWDGSKSTAILTETLKKEMKLFKPVHKKMNSDERLQALDGLQPTIRPRSVSGLIMSASRSILADAEGGASLTEFRLGESIQVRGMNERADLNGAHGEVVHDVPDSSGRLRVKLTLPSTNEVKVMRVKPERLRPQGISKDSPHLSRAMSLREYRTMPHPDGLPDELPIQPLPHCRRGYDRTPCGGFNSAALRGP